MHVKFSKQANHKPAHRLCVGNGKQKHADDLYKCQNITRLLDLITKYHQVLRMYLNTCKNIS